MGQNGVSHHVVRDDFDGVRTVLHLLSFAPLEMGGSLAPTLASSDPTDRDVGYLPAAGEKLDPRAAIDGQMVHCLVVFNLMYHIFGGEVIWGQSLFYPSIDREYLLYVHDTIRMVHPLISSRIGQWRHVAEWFV